MNEPADPKPADAGADPAPPAEWKPEPRQWSWRDLFTAPMLAFKPKCMLVSAVTLALLAGWAQLAHQAIMNPAWGANTVWYPLVMIIVVAVAALIFSLGATLVAVVMRADLLDDEFLSLKEALGQYRSRVAPAIMVPLFLLALVVAVNLLLQYLPLLVMSIPYAGSVLYAILYPIGFCLAILALLALVAVCLSIFVFPAIIAVRKHGWFDNVVDTVEAVGTKPHILAACLAATILMASVVSALGVGGVTYLGSWSAATNRVDLLPGNEINNTEAFAAQYSGNLMRVFDTTRYLDRRFWNPTPTQQRLGGASSTSDYGTNSDSGLEAMRYRANSETTTDTAGDSMGFYRYGPGLVVGLWQTLILALVAGYVLNVMLAGGMLTYLLVREDDYWDDEDLEDLDKLAKELEEEAKREEAAVPAAPVAAAEVPAATMPELPKA